MQGLLIYSLESYATSINQKARHRATLDSKKRTVENHEYFLGGVVYWGIIFRD